MFYKLQIKYKKLNLFAVWNDTQNFLYQFSNKEGLGTTERLFKGWKRNHAFLVLLTGGGMGTL